MYQDFEKITRAKFQQTLIEISMAIFPGYFKELYQYIISICTQFKTALEQQNFQPTEENLAHL